MNIVFVHFGQEIPDYLKRNLLSACLRFKEHKIILLRDSMKNQVSIDGLQVLESKNKVEFEEIKTLLNHPMDFRGGFWAHSLNRLLALADFVEQFNEPIIHFESDVLIARDFPFDSFDKIKEGLAFPLVSEERGIASTLYIRNLEAANLLKSVVINAVKANEESTDMTVLRKLYDLHTDQVSLLPTTADIQNCASNLTPEEIKRSWRENLELFKGCFDGADFGYFLLGSDPRNKRGVSLLRTTLNSHYVLANYAKFEFNTEREFVDQIVSNDLMPIFTLHATCKKTNLFKSRSTRMLKRRVKTQGKKSNSVFEFWALKYNLQSSVARRVRNKRFLFTK